MSDRPPDPYRLFLTDTSAIYFSHGDLHLSNIIVSGSPGCRSIAAILDWEQAGWYPEHWEYCKALIGTHYEHEWRSAGWSETFMKTDVYENTAVSEYWSWKQP